MPRNISVAMEAFAAAVSKRPALIVEIETAVGAVRCWSGIGDLVWNSDTYTGVGTLGGISSPEETSDLKSTGLAFTLSGVPLALIATVANDLRQGLPARLWLGGMTEGGALIADPVMWHEGTVAVPSTEEGAETCTLVVSSEDLLATLRRPRATRYTPEDQKIRDATDKGFDLVAGLQDAQKVWGRS